MQTVAINSWFQTFFDEKGLDMEEAFEFDNNYMPYGVVVESILGTSFEEKLQIKDILIKIDFQNGDVRHFLRHLGNSLALSQC